MKIGWALVCFLGTIVSPCLAQQQSTSDSLLAVYKAAKHDTLKVKALIALAEEVYLADPDKAMEYCQEVRSISERINYTKGKSTAYGWLAYLHEQKGNTDEALALNQKSLDLFEQLGDKKQMATCLNNIAAMYADMGQIADAFEYHDRSMRLKEEVGDSLGIASSLNNIGLLLFRQDKFDEAMEKYQRSLSLYKHGRDREGEATALQNIGGVYQKRQNWEQAMIHLQRSLDIRQEMKDQYGMAYTLNSIGQVLADQGNGLEAEEKYAAALAIRQTLGDRQGQAYTLKHLGNLLADRNENAKALSNLELSHQLFAGLADKKNQAEVLRTKAELHLRLGDLTTAERDGRKALTMAQDLQVPSAIREAADILSRIYAEQGRWDDSFAMSRLHLTLRDNEKKVTQGFNPFSHVARDGVGAPGGVPIPESQQGEWVQAFATHQLFQHMLDSVRNETTRSLTVKNQLQNDYAMKTLADSLQYVRKSETIALEVARKEADIKRQRVALLSTGAVILLLVVLALAIFFGKKRSDGLLLNILPKETAEELKRSGSAKARHFDSVTVIFTDFKGFTTISEQLSPQLLVEEINECFSAFDRIMEKHGMEKIKTIGDSYMAAGGLPTVNFTHALDAVRAAIDIQHYMDELSASKRVKGIPYFEIRIGIHTGPVVAGIVGIRKFQYDIWGDTVNTASRMESAGEVGRVNISESTYLLVKDHFNCSFRGEIETKGKGHVRMYFVDGGHR